jgi:acyl transferase
MTLVGFDTPRPAAQSAETTHAGFSLDNARGMRIHGSVDRPACAPVGRCVLLPAFGLSQLDLLTPAYYLLANGFEVIRFDPTCHVGESEGEIADFTLSGLAEDIRTVADAYADADTSIVAISLSSRPALRALQNRPLEGLFMVSPVVNTRQTLLAVSGEDLIGRELAGENPSSYRILGFEVKRSFCKDCIGQDFSDLDGTLTDVGGIACPTYYIVGSDDRWVDAGEVRLVAEAARDPRLVRVEGANHQIFRSPVVFQACMSALVQALSAHYELSRPPIIPQFRDVIAFVNGAKGNAFASKPARAHE